MQLNLKNPSIKRIMSELKEFQKDPSTDYTATHLEDNLFEWHFTIRGPRGTEFEGGVYHGRIILPSEYPLKPPHIILLTPNGRFQTNKKICLSVSAHHPETWQPSWSIRTVLIALISFMPTPGEGAIGSLDYKPEERRLLALKSKSWRCPKCDKTNEEILSDQVLPENSDRNNLKNSSNIIPQDICFKVETQEQSLTGPTNSQKNEDTSPTTTSSSESTTNCTPTPQTDLNTTPPIPKPVSTNQQQQKVGNPYSNVLDLIILSLFVLLVALLYNRAF